MSLQLSFESCGRILPGQSLALCSQSTSDAFVPLTGWLPVLVAEAVRAVVVCRAEGNFRWKLTCRKAATNIENPGTWNGSLEASYHTTGEFPIGDLEPTLGDDCWIQFGLQYSSSDGSLSSAVVTATLAVKKA